MNSTVFSEYRINGLFDAAELTDTAVSLGGSGFSNCTNEGSSLLRYRNLFNSKEVFEDSIL